MSTGTNIPNYEVSDLLYYAEMYQQSQRFKVIMGTIGQQIHDGYYYIRENLRITRLDGMVTIKVFKDGKLYTVSSFPWQDDFKPNGSSIASCFIVPGTNPYLTYSELLAQYFDKIKEEPLPGFHDFLLDLTNELSDIFVKEFNIDTYKFPYFNKQACYDILEEWKASGGSPGNLPTFEHVTEMTYGPDGLLLPRQDNKQQ